MTFLEIEIEGQAHKTIAFVALPIYTHIPNLKGLTKIFLKLSRPKKMKMKSLRPRRDRIES